MLKKIQECFREDRIYYSRHARDEMETEESGEIMDEEDFESVSAGKIIENYPEDEPYPSRHIYGRTTKNRPLHSVCAYSEDEKLPIVITVYQPNPGAVDRFFKEGKMKCIVCKGSDIELKTVDEQIRTERDIILVPMNILVCSSCGERYYDRKSIRKMEEIRKKLKNKELDVKEVGKVMRANAV